VLGERERASLFLPKKGIVLPLPTSKQGRGKKKKRGGGKELALTVKKKKEGGTISYPSPGSESRGGKGGENLTKKVSKKGEEKWGGDPMRICLRRGEKQGGKKLLLKITKRNLYKGRGKKREDSCGGEKEGIADYFFSRPQSQRKGGNHSGNKKGKGGGEILSLKKKGKKKGGRKACGNTWAEKKRGKGGSSDYKSLAERGEGGGKKGKKKKRPLEKQKILSLLMF